MSLMECLAAFKAWRRKVFSGVHGGCHGVRMGIHGGREMDSLE